MNRFYFKILFLFMLNACVKGLSMFRSKSPEPQYHRATGAVLDLHRSIEIGKSLQAVRDLNHHSEQREKKFFLNPAQLYHKKQIARADRSIKIHDENGKQLLMAEMTGMIKVTKSKSRNHDHYQARMPGIE
jgi:hypothetical protein